METRMLRIVADLLENKERQREFDRDPNDFMSRYDLDEEERALLFTCCKPLIAEAVRREIEAWELDLEIHYPGPEPHIAEVAPDHARSGEALSIQVRGEGILSSARFALVERGAPEPHRIEGDVRSITGTFRNTVMEVDVDLSGAKAGDYILQIINRDEVPLLSEMDPVPSRKEWPGIPPLVNYFPFKIAPAT